MFCPPILNSQHNWYRTAVTEAKTFCISSQSSRKATNPKKKRRISRNRPPSNLRTGISPWPEIQSPALPCMIPPSTITVVAVR